MSSDESNNQPVSVPDTVEMVAASASESTVNADVIVQAVAIDINTIATTAKDLYKSPLSTILTICGRSLLKDTPVSQNNIILIAHNVMESIESLKTLHIMQNIKGEQKKQLAVDCLHWMVNNNDELSSDTKVLINILIDTVVPNTIDTLIAISNGKSELVSAVINKCCIIS